MDAGQEQPGARTAGVNGIAPKAVAEVIGLLEAIRDDLKARRFQSDRLREVKIPKANGKVRRLGIATGADWVLQPVDNARTTTRLL